MEATVETIERNGREFRMLTTVDGQAVCWEFSEAKVAWHETGDAENGPGPLERVLIGWNVLSYGMGQCDIEREVAEALDSSHDRLDELVAVALDNAQKNGWNLQDESSEAIAIDLMTYNADFEDVDQDELIEAIRKYWVDRPAKHLNRIKRVEKRLREQLLKGGMTQKQIDDLLSK